MIFLPVLLFGVLLLLLLRTNKIFSFFRRGKGGKERRIEEVVVRTEISRDRRGIPNARERVRGTSTKTRNERTRCEKRDDTERSFGARSGIEKRGTRSAQRNVGNGSKSGKYLANAKGIRNVHHAHKSGGVETKIRNKRGRDEKSDGIDGTLES